MLEIQKVLESTLSHSLEGTGGGVAVEGWLAYLAPCPQRRTQSAAQWGRCCPGGTGRRSGRASAGRKMSRVQTPRPRSSAGSEGPGGLCSNKPMV